MSSDFQRVASGNVSADAKHVAQFYDDDAFLANEISRVLCVALDQGHGAVSIATQAHRAIIEKHLRARGIDVFAAGKRRQYVAADAADTLSEILIDGWPDAARFTEMVGGLVAPVSAKYSRVSIFGEMVAILWASGQCEAAIHIEKLWNELCKVQPIWLCCAYPVSAFSKHADDKLFRDVCAEHCRVLHAGSSLSMSADLTLAT